ncbi:Isochorismatase family protein [uncultured archaeon]|nr:Isochorismatase family protein [uncultured archaeon]
MRVFYDTDTQECFMNKDGALYVPDSELIKPNLKLLTDYAKKNRVPVLGSIDKSQLKENSKIPETVLSNHPVLLGNLKLERMNRAIDELDQVYAEYWLPNGIYFEKQSYDVFTNPNTKAFLEIAKPESAVVYGVETEKSVKAAVIGLQKMKVQCYVVTDGVKGSVQNSTALDEMVSAGAKLVKTKDILEGIL